MECSRGGIGYFGWMLGLPVIGYVFTPLVLLNIRWAVFGRDVPLSFWGAWVHYAWITLGLVVVCCVSALTVRFWRVPPGVWTVAAAAAIIGIVGLPVRAWTYAGGLGYSMRFENALDVYIGTSPYGIVDGIGTHVFALVGYVLAMALGCWLGSRTHPTNASA